jgi:hypothetical protein
MRIFPFKFNRPLPQAVLTNLVSPQINVDPPKSELILLRFEAAAGLAA